MLWKRKPYRNRKSENREDISVMADGREGGCFELPLGRFVIGWPRFTIKKGTVFCPLLRKLAVTPYKQYQEESLEVAVGQAIHLSYQLASKEVGRIKGSAPGKSTLYRRVQELAETYGQWPDSPEYTAKDVYDTRWFESVYGFCAEVNLAEGVQREVCWYRESQHRRVVR